jgi:rubrerythrin
VATEAEVARFQDYFQDEVDGIYYYRTLARLEADKQLSSVYLKMAQTEQRHLELWRDELTKAGAPPAGEEPSRRAIGPSEEAMPCAPPSSAPMTV